jgi:hypothetical protein
MSSPHQCPKCKKTFSNIGNLNVHLKNVCNDEIKTLECEYCHKDFKIQITLTRHYITCKAKAQQELNEEINIKAQYENLKTEFNKLLLKVNSLELTHKTELSFAKEKINLYEEENKRLSDLLASLTDKIPVSSSQTNSNNTVNINMAIFDQLKPITDETFFQYGQEITQTVLLQGLESVLNLGMKHLKDKVVCTDKSRNTLKYKMKDQIVNDKGGVRLAEQLIEQSIEPKVKMYDKVLVDVYKKKSRDHTTMKDEQAQLNSMIELRNAIVSNDDTLKTKIGSKLSKRAPTNHAMIADLNGATTQNMWEFFNQANKSCERIMFNSIEYFLVRDANKNVIRALEVDEDGLPIMNTDIDFSEHVQKLLPPPMHTNSNNLSDLPPLKERTLLDATDQKPKRGRPKKILS